MESVNNNFFNSENLKSNDIMNTINYSVVIRTLGLAGDKYMRLLNSLDIQTIKPLEIIVVLAEGYAIPKEQLGYEKFVFSKKGIVTQRSFGTKEAKGDYILFLDDDVVFEPTMAEELLKPLVNGIADVSFPLLTEMLPHGSSKVNAAIQGHTFPMVRDRRNNYVRILRSGGWSYNDKIDESIIAYYYSQSAPGTIYMANRKAALSIKFEEEVWLELYSFSFPDDQINIYKYHSLGYKIVGVSGLKLQHLDGLTEGLDRKAKATYAGSKHGYIFWHRFIYKPDNNPFSKFYSLICYSLPFIPSTFVGFIKAVKLRNFRLLKLKYKGLKDGIAFTKTQDYKNLPIIDKSNYPIISK